MRSGDLGPLLEDRDVVIFERFGVGALQPVDIGKDIVAQDLPVEFLLADFPAEFLAVLKVLGEVGAVNEHLLRHAAADHAGAADPMRFRQRHLGAMRGGHAAGAHAARSPADGEEIVIVFAICHCRRAPAFE